MASISMVRAGEPAELDPPSWEIPGVVPAERMVTRSVDVVVSVGQIRVFSTGLLATFCVRFRPGREPGLDLAELERLLHGEQAPSSGRLMLGVRYADGACHTNVVAPEAAAILPAGARARLRPLHGGGSGRGVWWATYWLAPARFGDVTFLASWPAHEIPLGETVVGSAELRSARDAVQQLD